LGNKIKYILQKSHESTGNGYKNISQLSFTWAETNCSWSVAETQYFELNESLCNMGLKGTNLNGVT